MLQSLWDLRSPTRNGTQAPAVEARSSNHWTGREFSTHYFFLMCVLSCFSHVQLFVTRWTVAHQAPLSVEFSMQEYWSGLPFPSPGNLPDPGTEPALFTSAASAGGFFTTSTTWEAPFFLTWKDVKSSKLVLFTDLIQKGGGWIFFFSSRRSTGFKVRKHHLQDQSYSVLPRSVHVSSRSVFSSVTWGQNIYFWPCC